MQSINEHADPTICRVMCGNKIDKEGRAVSKKEGQALADEVNVNYHDVSAKTGEGVIACMEDLMEQVYVKKIL